MSASKQESTNLKEPIIANYLVLTALKDKEKGLLSEGGHEVWTDYTTLDWKGLAKSIEQDIAGKLPSGTQVYVWNDGQDAIDLTMPDQESDWVSRAVDVGTSVGWNKYRGGVCDVSAFDGMFHCQPISTLRNGERAPLAALVISLKFKTFTHFADYYYSAGLALFGEHCQNHKAYEFMHDKEAQLDLPKAVHAWLADSFGISNYSDKCAVYMLPCKRVS